MPPIEPPPAGSTPRSSGKNVVPDTLELASALLQLKAAGQPGNRPAKAASRLCADRVQQPTESGKRELLPAARPHNATHPNSGVLFCCNFCGRGFSQKGNVNKHERTHTGDKPFRCNFCSKRFIEKSSAVRHERTHTGEKPFPCTTCGKRFGQKGDMTKHRRSHSGEKPFPCKTCGKRFGYKGSVAVHERSHTGERPYKCARCDTIFGTSSAARRHERAQHTR